MGFTLSECKSLPLMEKRWYIERMLKEIKQSSDAEGAATQSRAIQHNTPDMRALQNRVHPNPPARLRRFT
jgi:hypothetical protein